MTMFVCLQTTGSLLLLVALLVMNNTLVSYYPTASSSSMNDDGRMLLVRPFTTHDVDKMATSFDTWLPPCAADSSTKDRVDLALFFSQNLQHDSSTTKATVLSTVEDMISMFETEWKHCFGRLIIQGVDVVPDDDIYDTHAQQERADWVSGPNRQFERTIRLVQEEGRYETMFLMESDSVPMKDNWLHALVEELEVQRPFAILGR
jgi:hypothetical protein